MKSVKMLGAVVAGFVLLVSTPVLAGTVGDDFNDNAKDTAKWGSDDSFGSSATLLEANGHLQFGGNSPSVDIRAGIMRPWLYSYGSYTSNWEVSADVNVGNLTLNQNDEIEMFLGVAPSGLAVNENNFTVTLDVGLDSQGSYRGYYSAMQVNGFDVGNEDWVETTDLQGRVSIRFDATTKVLSAYYNGTPLGSRVVPSGWGMTGNSTFRFALGGSLGSSIDIEPFSGMSYSGTGVYADNFQLISSDNPTYLLTVNNGAGGGNYTNGAIVTVTASNAPSGQVFDRWFGATQYVQNVFSATTTVTMPAQAITLTAVYKPFGATFNDDFNDNVKDTAKWGSDDSFGSSATLLEANGHLQFGGTSTLAGVRAEIVRPWSYSYGSYTSNWEVAADVHVGALSLQQNDEIEMFLGVAPSGLAVNQNNFTVSLDVGLDSQGSYRGYYSAMLTNGYDMGNEDWVDTTDLQGRVSIRFDAATKVLSAYYNGIPLGSRVVPSGWGMTGSSTFGFALGGSLGSSIDLEPFSGMSYSGTDVYADNFMVYGGISPSIEPTKIIGLSGNLAFGNVTTGTTATALMTITNSGNTALTVTSIMYPFPTCFSGAWSGTVAAGKATNVTVTFAPVDVMNYSGIVTVNSDRTSGTNTISASCAGTAAPAKIIGLSGNLAFGNVTTGTTATAIMTITNSGNTALTVTSITYPFPTCFSGAWSGTVAAGKATNVTVTFAPVAVTNYSGTVTVNSDKTSGTNTISASGTGTAVPTKIIGLSGNLSFGSVVTGQTSAATLTITNSGNTALTVTSIGYPTCFSGAWSGTVAAGKATNVTVAFAPVAVTNYSGTVTVNSDKTSGTNTISASGSGIEVQALDYTYTTNSGQITITRYIGSGGAVVIPDMISGLPVVGFGTAFNQKKNITSIMIGANVTSIEYEAFFFCTGLTSVIIGNSVTNIGDYAFSYCSSLTNATIGNSVTIIGAGTFKACTSLPSVSIPDSVTNIGDYAVSYCSSLTNTIIGTNVTSIGTSTFYNCSSLISVTIPDSVTSIGKFAFESCTSLLGVSIPDSVTSIGVGTFQSCTSLLGVSIPDSVTNIGNVAFSYCSSLTNTIIGTNVTSIGSSAFYSCTSLPSVSIPDSVTNIGDFAFSHCSSLTNTIIGSNVTSIGEEAFSSCIRLTSVYFEGNAPSSVGKYMLGASSTPATVYRLYGAAGWPPVPDLWAGRPTALWGFVPTKVIGLSGNLSFGSVVTGQTSAATLTITNSGNTALTVTSITYPTCFSGAWSGTVAAGNATNVTVTFAPVAITNYSGTVTVNSDATGGTNTISALGTGIPVPTKIIGLSGNLSFGSVVTGQASTASLTITNSGNTALTVTGITYPTCFSGAWSGTVAAGNATNVTVTFAPVAATNYSGTVTVNSDKTSGTNTIGASGAGIQAPTKIIGLSGNLSFGSVVTGQTSMATLTITNSGNTALMVTNITYPACFSGTWSGTVGAGNATNVTVTFAPLSVTNYSGTVTVNSDKTSGTNTIACMGTGTVAVRYVDNGDGTVTDTATGLMWTKNADHGRMSWADAGVYCDNLVTSGYSDWRLPTVARDGGTAELDTLFRANGNPSGSWEGVAETPFTDVKSYYYWSGTPNASYTDRAWFVNISYGSVIDGYDKTFNFYVWPVRDGTTTHERIIQLSSDVNFGSCQTGLTSIAKLTIYNYGNDVLTVTGIQYSVACFSGNWAGTLLAGGSTNVIMTFAPAAVTNYSGTVTVNSDKTSGTNTISVSGSGVAVQAGVLVEDSFSGSVGSPPDATKFEWGGEVVQNGFGQLYLNTGTANTSWLRSKAGAAPGLGQTLVLQMRAQAYAEPHIYGDGQPRGLRVGSDANNVVEFYSIWGNSIGLRVRKNGVESLATYAFPAGVWAMHDYEISVTTTSAVFKVDGVLAGTVTSNIPTGALNVYVATFDGYAGNVPVYLDSLSLTLTGNQVTLPDLDADGIPDWWEEQHFGGSTNANPNAVCSNRVNTVIQAYVAGLNPTNSSARFGITQNPRNVVQWSAVSGRVYAVYWATNLLAGFQCLESNIPWTRGNFTNPTAVPCGYYKIDVRLE